MTTVTLDGMQRDALALVYWHRLVSTDQVHRLVAPAAPARTVRHKLLALHRAGLLERIVRAHRPRTWFATPRGSTLVEASGLVDAREYRVPGTAVVELLQGHALDVVETGLAFVTAARSHGHDCGPLSWTPEVAHPFQHRPSGRGRGVVISDAVLHYVLEEPGRRTQRAFFLELDRATMPVARLAAKLRNYVRYHDYVPPGTRQPAWRQRYPRFPRLLIVLSGASEHALARRLVDLRAYAQAMPGLTVAGERVWAAATTLPHLCARGPLADVAVPLLTPDGTPVPVLGSGR